MPREKTDYTGKKVLLVEGKNDRHVVYALCGAYNIPLEIFFVEDCENDEQAIAKMDALITSSERPETIGLMLDADKPDVRGRWQRIQSELWDKPYVLPSVPDADRTIVESVNDLPRLGFWLMPDNKTSGRLEDFCIGMIDAGAVTLAEGCLRVAKKRGCASYKEVHHSKAVVHTYLAWQDEPGRPLGQAITAQSLRPDTPTAQTFADWLIRLFGQ